MEWNWKFVGEARALTQILIKKETHLNLNKKASYDVIGFMGAVIYNVNAYLIFCLMVFLWNRPLSLFGLYNISYFNLTEYFFFFLVVVEFRFVVSVLNLPLASALATHSGILELLCSIPIITTAIKRTEKLFILCVYFFSFRLFRILFHFLFGYSFLIYNIPSVWNIGSQSKHCRCVTGIGRVFDSNRYFE